MQSHDSFIAAISETFFFLSSRQAVIKRFWSQPDKRHHLCSGLLLDNDCFSGPGLFCHTAASSRLD